MDHNVEIKPAVAPRGLVLQKRLIELQAAAADRGQQEHVLSSSSSPKDSSSNRGALSLSRGGSSVQVEEKNKSSPGRKNRKDRSSGRSKNDKKQLLGLDKEEHDEAATLLLHQNYSTPGDNLFEAEHNYALESSPEMSDVVMGLDSGREQIGRHPFYTQDHAEEEDLFIHLEAGGDIRGPRGTTSIDESYPIESMFDVASICLGRSSAYRRVNLQ